MLTDLSIVQQCNTIECNACNYVGSRPSCSLKSPLLASISDRDARVRPAFTSKAASGFLQAARFCKTGTLAAFQAATNPRCREFVSTAGLLGPSYR